jgi:hypothetical protein
MKPMVSVHPEHEFAAGSFDLRSRKNGLGDSE